MFRFTSQFKATKIYFMVSRSFFYAYRFFLLNLERLYLSFSSNTPDWQSPSKIYLRWSWSWSAYLSLLAFSNLVSYFIRFVNWDSFTFTSRFNHGRGLQDSEAFPSSGVAYWIKSSREAGISKRVAICALQSNRFQTLLKYQRHWRQFHSWFHKKQNYYSEITVDSVARFLYFLFKNGSMSTGNQLSVESLNQIRSSVSFFLQYDIPDLGFDITITRLFKYFYLKRPSFTKNVVTWDVGKVLKFLAYWHPIES